MKTLDPVNLEAMIAIKDEHGNYTYIRLEAQPRIPGLPGPDTIYSLRVKFWQASIGGLNRSNYRTLRTFDNMEEALAAFSTLAISATLADDEGAAIVRT